MSTKKNFPERDFNMNKEKLTRVGLEALVNFSLFIQNLSKCTQSVSLVVYDMIFVKNIYVGNSLIKVGCWRA